MVPLSCSLWLLLLCSCSSSPLVSIGVLISCSPTTVSPLVPLSELNHAPYIFCGYIVSFFSLFHKKTMLDQFLLHQSWNIRTLPVASKINQWFQNQPVASKSTSGFKNQPVASKVNKWIQNSTSGFKNQPGASKPIIGLNKITWRRGLMLTLNYASDTAESESAVS